MKRTINGHEVLFDKRDSELVGGYNWNCYQNSCGQIYFSVYDKNSKRILKLHRELVSCPDGYYVDHINGNTLDNRRKNLRVCRKIQNQYNQKKHKNARHSKFKGVTFREGLSKPWEAFIYPNGKSLRLGYFRTEKEAAAAYNTAARHYYGEFAKLNDIGG